MAYDSTGKWTPEDDNVDTEVNRITSQDSQIMQNAATQGLKQANRRGLMNSSIGVQSAQKAVIDTALPMASQNASQTASKNLGAQTFSQNQTIQNTELEATKQRQETDIAAQKDLQTSQIDRDKYLATFDRDTQERLKTMDVNLQQQLAQMNLASNDREKAGAMVAAAQNSYAAMFQSIAANPDIPAATRDKYLEHAGAVLSSQLAMVEQIMGINLDWPTPGS